MNIEQPIQSVVNGKPAVVDAFTQTAAVHVDAAAVAAAEAVQARKQPAPVGAVKAAAQQIDSYLKSTGRNLDIHVDEETGQTVVTVRDATTGDVIRQIPNEEALRLARSLGDGGSALLSMSV